MGDSAEGPVVRKCAGSERGAAAPRQEFQAEGSVGRLRELGECFDVALCFGILHRVTDPIALLQALADVLTPGGEIVLET